MHWETCLVQERDQKPMVKEANIRDGTTILIADISIRGLWQPQTLALLDMRVVDTDAPSYIHWNTDAVLSSSEEKKKRKYNIAAEAFQASFTPFVVSTDGMLGREANKRQTQTICIKWINHLDKPQDSLRTRLYFAILCATIFAEVILTPSGKLELNRHCCWAANRVIKIC